MWGIIPAAGSGTRIQPLAFSKELLPVGSRLDGGTERPRAVSEYLVDRMVRGGADKIAFVIAPGKSDILQYYGDHYASDGYASDGYAGDGTAGAAMAYVVQPRPGGLCDALFRARHLIHPSEPVMIGLPDTVWFPEDALAALPDDTLSFLLFPVEQPQVFDAVVTDERGRVLEIQVKSPHASTNWIWGAFKMPGSVFHDLHRLWVERERQDEYMGTLVNAWIAAGGEAVGVRAGTSYVDVGTVRGYRAAIGLLSQSLPEAAE